MTAVQIFDRKLLRQRRERAAGNLSDADFLFSDVAARLAERLDVVKKELPVVLDLGSATGALSTLLKARKGTQAVFSADLSAVLAAKSDMSLVADEEFLPIRLQSLDAVVSALGLHWVNDLPGALLQIRQALKADGVFLAALLGGESLKELRACLMEAELQVTGGASPRVSPFADMRDVGALLQRAGFALPVVDSEILSIEYADAFALMRDLRAMGAANATLNRLKKPTRRRVLLEAARLYQEKFVQDDGLIPATFEVIYMIGWAPHDSQQKPLPPGSAKARLAEALQVREIPAGEKAG